MTYHLYRRPNGQLEVNEYKLSLEIFPGYSYVSEYEDKPDLSMLELAADNTVQLSLDKSKAALVARIEQERDLRLVAPVLVYDGINLDADQLAKNNLADVLTRVNSTLTQGQELLPQELVWKDHDNFIRTFPDTLSYKNWLDGFVMALGQRNTAIWAWSWQKKAELAAANSIEELRAITLN